MWLVSLLSDNGILRKSRGLVTFVDGADGVKSGAVVQTTAQAMFSRAAQLVNGVSHIGGKMASFEPNFWRLDGSFMLPVGASHSQMEIGFVSLQMSDVEGIFSSVPEIVISFPTARNLPLVAVVFDHAAGEAAGSLRFRAFDGANNVILDEVVQNVDRANVLHSTRGANGVRRVVISVLTTINPLRRARIAEVHFGRVLQYDGEDIVQVNSVAQADPACRAFPQNRLRVKIFNKGRFGVLGDEGDARHLRQRQTVEYAQMTADGAGERWMHLGNFALDSWEIRENMVELLAYGRSSGLGNEIYRDSAFEMFTLGQMARDVARAAGFEVIVPRCMDVSPFIPRFFGNVSHRAALIMIAELASCMLYEDRRGVLRFVDILDEASALTDRLDYEKLFVPPKIEMGAFYNGVILTETWMTIEQGQASRADIDVSGSANVMIPFDRPIFSGGHAEVSVGFSLINPRFHAMYMTGTLTGNGRCTLEIHGMRAAFAGSETFYRAPWFAASQGEHPYVVKLPVFLHNMTHLSEVREWFLRRKFGMMSKRIGIDADWRQNPALDVGDGVLVQVDRAGRMVDGAVVRQEVDFDSGVLRGKTGVLAGG